MVGRLVALTLLIWTIGPAPGAVAAALHRPVPSPGSIAIRLVGVPRGPAGNPLARVYVVDRLAPGRTIRRRVEIANTTRAIADVAVYPAAASMVRGAFEFASATDGQDELSTWTSVSRRVLRLAPGTAASDTLTIRVPRDASPGQQYAVLWAQVSAPSADGVMLVNRVGIRMYVSIGPGGAPPPDFSIGSLTAERSAAGQLVVATEIHNNGYSPLAVTGHLTLSDGPGGLDAGSLPARIGAVLAPGESEPVTVRLSKSLPRGPWRAQLWLTSGLLHRSAAATITFPGRPGTAETPAARWLTLAVILLLALLAAAVLALVISRRRTSGMQSLPS